MEETDFKKVALRWVPYTLTKEQKDRRVIAAREINPPNSAWVRRGEEAPKRVAKGIASPKVLVTTTNFISNSIFSKLRQPAYSPDLAPSDFFLFGYLNGALKGNTFESAVEALAVTQNILSKIDSRTLRNVFNNWLIRLRYAIEQNGACYED
ncbi:MAG: hypothetical protein EZS28_036661 [Streblomastix strix]|uniref:Uncharacterized protein n=1 Tax=Streblomastix strix TaxID=222440 RepID=A0A5J4UCC0_9EUKA|nr:MAG: hypothetical protein EZS28_036661 [Streblomastix strix]